MKIFEKLKGTYQFLLGILFTIAYSGVALAQSGTTITIGGNGIASDIFTPSAGDKSMQILQALFGGIPAFGGSSGSDAFAAPIGTFNQLVLIVGGVLTTYTILVGTMMTAHDGEVLGKQFHSIWIPIRTAVGSALVLPLFNGYCVAQVVVAWLLVQGIGLADKVWDSFTSNSNLTNVVAIGFNDPATYKLVQDVLKAKMCVAAMNAEITANPSLYSGAQFGMTTVSTPDVIIPADEYNIATTIPGSTVYKFGNTTGTNSIPTDVCGTVTVKNYQGTSTDTASNVSTINAAQLTALNTLYQESDSLITTAINTVVSQSSASSSYDTTAMRASVNKLMLDYNSAVKSKAAGAYNNAQAFNTIKDNAAQDGWFLAGSWFMKLAAMQEEAQQAVSAVPSSTSIGDATENDTVKQSIAKYMPILTQITAQTMAQSDFGITKQTQSDNQPDFAQALLSKITVATISPSENPVMAMKRLGDSLLTVISVIFAAVAGIFTSGPAMGLLTFVVMLMPLLTVILVLGITLSFVLPMMPMFIWIGAAIGWLILAVEAIIAAPLWVVMHLNPKGSDLVGTAGKGYMMVLSLMLRPVLMVFGLVAAIIMTNVVGQFIATVYTSIFTMSQQNSNWIIWLVGAVIAGPLIYGSMMFVFIKKMFSVIHIIPDQLLGWIGGGGPSLGEYSRQMSASGAVALNQGMQQLSSMGSQMGNHALGKMRDGLAAKNQDKQNVDQLSDMGAQFGDSQNQEGGSFSQSMSGLLGSAGGELSGASTHQKSQARAGAIKSAGEKIGAMAQMFGGTDTPQFQNMMKTFNANALTNPPKTNDEFNQQLTAAATSALSSQYSDNKNPSFISSNAEGIATSLMNANTNSKGGFDIGGVKKGMEAIQSFSQTAKSAISFAATPQGGGHDISGVVNSDFSNALSNQGSGGSFAKAVSEASESIPFSTETHPNHSLAGQSYTDMAKTGETMKQAQMSGKVQGIMQGTPFNAQPTSSGDIAAKVGGSENVSSETDPNQM
jgi:conjugal transfer/type IV secretion protein DotA/TraY